MVTDRVATNALLMILMRLYPSQSAMFILLACLDLSSHWFRMYASLLSGGASHKSSDVKRDGLIVTTYYTNRIVLGGVCLFNEAFYVALYCLFHFGKSQPLVRISFECLRGGVVALKREWCSSALTLYHYLLTVFL